MLRSSKFSFSMSGCKVGYFPFRRSTKVHTP